MNLATDRLASSVNSCMHPIILDKFRLKFAFQDPLSRKSNQGTIYFWNLARRNEHQACASQFVPCQNQESKIGGGILKHCRTSKIPVNCSCLAIELNDSGNGCRGIRCIKSRSRRSPHQTIRVDTLNSFIYIAKGKA